MSAPAAITTDATTNDATTNDATTNDTITKDSSSNDGFRMYPNPVGIVLTLEDGTKITSIDPEYPFINRIVALKNLQMDTLEVEQEFHRELDKVHVNYLQKIQSLCKRRRRIVDGSFMPPPSFGQYKSAIQRDTRLRDKFNYEKLQYFWLVVLSQFPLIEEIIKPADVPILEHLNDICVGFDGENYFTIEFHFETNEYFSNPVLMKRYYEVIEIDMTDPFEFDGPEIYKSEGSVIHWKTDKNVTRVKFSEQVPDDSGLPVTTTPTNYVKAESFFNFFDPPQFPSIKTVVDMELERTLTIDFEIGNILRNQIIPNAIPIFINALEEMEEDDDLS